MISPSSDAIILFDGTDHLKVTWKDMVIAEDGERFVPTHGGIYAYSQKGADREWLLPEEYRNATLKVFELTDKGRKEFSNFKITDGKIFLKLSANQSVKIIIE